MPALNVTPESLLMTGRDVLRLEAAAVAALEERLDADFVGACELLLNCSGRIVVSGMGKSGIIAKKIAATLASTGSPALFLHPAEGSHGDLGMLTRQDCLLALSNSGETAELLAILPVVKRLAVPLLAMTGNPQSTLARTAAVHLNCSVAREACPLNLAPTASTTASLAMGDALAMAILQARGFSADDFALSHPGGSLGKRLLLRVQDVMHRGDAIPRVGLETPLQDAVLEISSKGLGMTAVVDAEDRVVGIFTDGDLRRAFAQRQNLWEQPMAALAHARPATIAAEALAAEALALMEHHRIGALLVTDSGARLIGALNMHDLLRAGIV
ncbi:MULTISPECIES: KpsF/GutQ family sugar-phosphate isomerase [Acidithiobacillus]|jgi:arabinose-5-phosphate isomerase|uniref:KpsF/GutQ family sugar-phosphate isomerase n=2 Tax=Acidithiobacillus ferridurans TaxID=1232575 RepID=A0A8X8KCK5_ACIFI|nr:MULTISPECIES: KpsF/GutQ family sugar-phosphate isomerase [Acidithiobacillus]MBU2716084.1 KpsF/GutQ family sugar-phosphate isomerase [Acidithiobacillus ferridurans]MBU2721290.1 KpsF/GutQ family sugar-phosphate isomerase [Acidithiobacillus ferridurans]MBU2723504.1 KpsF/GutQ family sugar-phosphate isomerase [Acidithiobacillus ferridurans]MBU2726595.1 KpsF/GutQ family sugar-phosphate isomerase [Acidithiobacillus ferridurans]MBU2733334.1 KpsF/GutQ family sugar-phosphate isomerase [Acidithiobacil